MNNKLKEIKKELDKLTSEERKELFWIYCVHCGSKDSILNTECFCWRDD